MYNLFGDSSCCRRSVRCKHCQYKIKQKSYEDYYKYQILNKYSYNVTDELYALNNYKKWENEEKKYTTNKSFNNKFYQPFSSPGLYGNDPQFYY
jgi:hypothetical protein